MIVMTDHMLSLTGSIFTVICILALAYWCSRLLGRTWGRTAPGSNLKVVEQLSVGRDSRLMVVRVKERSYLIGISAAGIQMLAEIEGELEEAGALAGELKFPDLLKYYTATAKMKKRDPNE